MADDPFPRERLSAMLRRTPAYLRLSWRLAREPLLSKARRMAVVGAAGYLASPIDLVPGVIPVLGQLDDLAVALAALRLALAGLSPEHRQRHLAAVGLEDAHLAEDLWTVAATTAWIGRASYRSTKRVAIAGGRAAASGAGAAARQTRSAITRATPAAKATVDRITSVPGARTVAAKTAPMAKAALAKTSPAANAAVARATPMANSTRRAVTDAGARAAGAGSKVLGATGSRFGRFQRPGHPNPNPEILVTEVDLPLLPPPPPRPITS